MWRIDQRTRFPGWFFSLSLRLAMAEAVLFMDDPFVDIDPERMNAGAELILKFSLNTQIVFITCHPGRAALFSGATVVELPPAGSKMI